MAAGEVEIEVTWEAVVTQDDGTDVNHGGTERVRAGTAQDACWAVQRRVIDRFEGAQRPVTARAFIGDPGAGASTAWGSTQVYPAGVPDAETIRMWRRGGRTPAQMLGAIRGEAAALAPLAYMLVFERSFSVARAGLREIAGWCRGELDDAALDAAIVPRIDAMKSRWNRPFALREARRAGASVAAVINEDAQRGEGTVYLIVSVREAFPGLSLRDAITVASGAGHSPDAQLDAELEAALAKR
jgi:hypothetical protein